MTDALAALAKAPVEVILGLTVLVVVALGAYALVHWLRNRGEAARHRETLALEEQLQATRAELEAEREAARAAREAERDRTFLEALGSIAAEASTRHDELLERFTADRAELARSLAEVIDSSSSDCAPCAFDSTYRGRVIELHKVATAERGDGSPRVHGSSAAETAAARAAQVAERNNELLTDVRQDVRDIRDRVATAAG